MSIVAMCGCGKQYSLAEQLAGKKVKCKACGNAFVVSAAPAMPTKTDAAGLAPEEEDRKLHANARPARAGSLAPKKPASPPPAKHDAAWESLLTQQDAALRAADEKRAQEDAKWAEIEARNADHEEQLARRDDEKRFKAAQREVAKQRGEPYVPQTRAGKILYGVVTFPDRWISVPAFAAAAFVTIGFGAALSDPKISQYVSAFWVIVTILLFAVGMGRGIVIVLKYVSFEDFLLGMIPGYGLAHRMEVNRKLWAEHGDEMRGPFVNNIGAITQGLAIWFAVHAFTVLNPLALLLGFNS